ncbi:hypothetical protein Pst134EA_032597 [Puccinia striiformis f. sp. tritici]|uniref:uncharacterized protein n=1 Tax=Puccinia striiformis f. sp. tritici TaxID=168172 RepID=UPI002008B7BF|nr:uncharacterized protein Pst134EA_032597 [Puccinia striiformis f. sp. tritici]KAH9441692.1 hypothetical protein Pst134EA_032597 [Puccinia striiformis f. sp. tritici]
MPQVSKALPRARAVMLAISLRGRRCSFGMKHTVSIDPAIKPYRHLSGIPRKDQSIAVGYPTHDSLSPLSFDWSFESPNLDDLLFSKLIPEPEAQHRNLPISAPSSDSQLPSPAGFGDGKIVDSFRPDTNYRNVMQTRNTLRVDHDLQHIPRYEHEAPGPAASLYSQEKHMPHQSYRVMGAKNQFILLAPGAGTRKMGHISKKTQVQRFLHGLSNACPPSKRAAQFLDTIEYTEHPPIGNSDPLDKFDHWQNGSSSGPGVNLDGKVNSGRQSKNKMIEQADKSRYRTGYLSDLIDNFKSPKTYTSPLEKRTKIFKFDLEAFENKDALGIDKAKIEIISNFIKPNLQN